MTENLILLPARLRFFLALEIFLRTGGRTDENFPGRRSSPAAPEVPVAAYAPPFWKPAMNRRHLPGAFQQPIIFVENCPCNYRGARQPHVNLADGISGGDGDCFRHAVHRAHKKSVSEACILRGERVISGSNGWKSVNAINVRAS